MKFHVLPHMARVLALVTLVAGVLALAADSRAWSSLSGSAATSRVGRSTVPHNDADLSITKSYRRVGRSDVIFTIVVKNNGPVAAKDVIMTDILSQRLKLEWAGTNKGSCKGRSAVTCKLGNLAVGQVVTMIIRVEIKSKADRRMIVNTAMVRSKTHDPHMSNNTASVKFHSR